MITPECDQIHPMSTGMKFLVLVLCLLVLAAGIGTGVYFIKTRPVPPQRPPVPLTAAVLTTTVTSSTQTVVIQAMGTVVPARQTTIRSNVAGTVLEVADAFLPGGIIARGKPLLRLEPDDFLLAVSSGEAELERARADLELELGHQAVARHEWDLVNRKELIGANPSLALRQPQLAQARAKVRQAETALERAKLDLNRTTISAPFTALVLEKHVDMGSRISTQDALALLVDSGEYWIEATVPVDRLSWVAFPEKNRAGSPVRVHSRASGARKDARVLRLRGELESDGRLAQVLISLPEPTTSTPTPILLGEYVELEIIGRALDNVILLPRVALRENDTVWTVQNATLDIRPVAVAWRDTETVLVEGGLEAGDLVVTSELATPIQNMPVTLAQSTGN